MEENFWKKCSACKKPIPFKAKYYICSVSTCQGQRTGYGFCSVPCWDSHVADARHRSAGALERIAPATHAPDPANIIRRSSDGTLQSARPPAPATSSTPKEVLIIASRLKEYVTAKSGFNTSASVMDELSEIVRNLTDDAIEKARAEGRKTLMDRDFR